MVPGYLTDQHTSRREGPRNVECTSCSEKISKTAKKSVKQRKEQGMVETADKSDNRTRTQSTHRFGVQSTPLDLTVTTAIFLLHVYFACFPQYQVLVYSYPSVDFRHLTSLSKALCFSIVTKNHYSMQKHSADDKVTFLAALKRGSFVGYVVVAFAFYLWFLFVAFRWKVAMFLIAIFYHIVETTFTTFCGYDENGRYEYQHLARQQLFLSGSVLVFL